MATSGLGASNTQILNLKLNHKSQLCVPFLSHGMQLGKRPKAWKYSGVRLSLRSNRGLSFCQSQHQSTLVTENEADSSVLEEADEQSSSRPVSELIPNVNEVTYLLTEICGTTSIKEFELKLDGFQLLVRRAQTGGIDPPPLLPSPSGSASIDADTAAEALATNGFVSTSSLAITKVGTLIKNSGTLLDRAADEGLVVIQSPKVGFFRRSRTIKGKRAPPACKEKQVVKEGQVICYIEQLGGEIPVESDVSGEVIRILREDGESVGYNDAIIAILPSFPGIKKLPS